MIGPAGRNYDGATVIWKRQPTHPEPKAWVTLLKLLGMLGLVAVVVGLLLWGSREFCRMSSDCPWDILF